MSDAIVTKVEDLLKTVSTDIHGMQAENLDNNEMFVQALDDLAANILGLQSVIAAMVKTYPVDTNAAKEWLKANMDTNGEGTEKADAVVDYILGNETP